MSTTNRRNPANASERRTLRLTPQNAESWLPGIRTASSYWCLRTMGPAGPDDHFVHLSRCVPVAPATRNARSSARAFWSRVRPCVRVPRTGIRESSDSARLLVWRHGVIPAASVVTLHPRGILFDMDGVLVSSLGSVERSWRNGRLRAASIPSWRFTRHMGDAPLKLCAYCAPI